MKVSKIYVSVEMMGLSPSQLATEKCWMPVKQHPEFKSLKNLVISHKSKNPGMSQEDRKDMNQIEAFLNFAEIYILLKDFPIESYNLIKIRGAEFF